MSHFNKKSLAFYGIAIGSVVTLFSAVSSYGERTLKAPIGVEGEFELTLDPQGNCSQPQPLQLTIQQSGIYLTAALEKSASQPTPLPTRAFSLQGGLKTQQFHLVGVVNQLGVCTPNRDTVAVRQSGETVEITGTVSEQTIVGELEFSSVAEKFKFTAKPTK
jgi:hypothetical protein